MKYWGYIFCLMLIITGCSTSNNNIDNLELTKYFKVKFNTTKYLSMCVCNDKMYALANDSDVYFVTDLKNKITHSKKIPIEIDNPTSITFAEDNIYIIDVINKNISMFNNEFKFIKRIALKHYPISSYIYGGNIYYVTDVLHNSTYRYVLLKENLRIHKTNILFMGDSLNALSLRQNLDLDNPHTLCFSGYEDYIYITKQNSDKRIVYKIDDDSHIIWMKDSLWKPVEYNIQERAKSLDEYTDILSPYNYPINKIKLTKKPSICGLCNDKDGNVWIVSPIFDDASKLIIEIYSPDADLLKSFKIDAVPLENLKISLSSNFLSLSYRENKHSYIQLYKLNWRLDK